MSLDYLVVERKRVEELLAESRHRLLSSRVDTPGLVQLAQVMDRLIDAVGILSARIYPPNVGTGKRRGRPPKNAAAAGDSEGD